MRKRNILILVGLLIIGYASLTAILQIRSKITIGAIEDDYNVYFSDCYFNNEEHKEYISTDGKSITFKTSKLTNVGEQVILKYEITNTSSQYASSIDMHIKGSNTEYLNIEHKKEYDVVDAKSKGKGERIIECSYGDNLSMYNHEEIEIIE